MKSFEFFGGQTPDHDGEFGLYTIEQKSAFYATALQYRVKSGEITQQKADMILAQYKRNLENAPVVVDVPASKTGMYSGRGS